MSKHLRSSPDTLADFKAKLAASLADGTFVRVVLSGGPPTESGVKKVIGRCIDLAAGPHLSLTLRYPTRDEVCNVPLRDAMAWISAKIGVPFHSALLRTTNADWQLAFSSRRGPRLIRHEPAMTSPPDRQHDEARHVILGNSARDWLCGLGVVDESGRVRPGLADKYAQINRYLEVFSHLAKEARWIGPAADDHRGTGWTIADMGSGKGYLTFGLWHLFHRVWGLPAQVVGLEVRPDLVDKSNRLAESIGARELRFSEGSIESAELPELRALIALHACDTATDQAVFRGIDAHAQLIVLAPCCHKEIRPQLAHPGALAAVLRHGVMEERMAEWVTDGLRALFLEWAGYRTKVFEFVSSEHTPKNLMITAVRDWPSFTNESARKRIEELKALFGITNQSLDPLLTRTPAQGMAMGRQAAPTDTSSDE